ncbi:MAG: hypothetical protein RRY29_06570 [Desulfovibrionaceae bacterium]
MRRFYQESWQGIPFGSFSHVSFFHLADAKFYAIFYEVLFKRFTSWGDLPAQWRNGKENAARWLALQILSQRHHWEDGGGDNPSVVLSVGSGLGFMEKMLLDVLPHMELHVNEPSTMGMKWLRECLPPEYIHIGPVPACLPAGVHYNCIYLSTVDYGIPQAEFARMLEDLRGQLADGGRLICLSASLLEEDSCVGRWVNAVKIGIRAVLHFTGLRRQQFWGWRRTRAEYHELFAKAGFRNVQDGFLEDGMETFWISGE